jgi:predicted type IV restriction endonuclease
MMSTSAPEHTGAGAGTTADEWEGYHIVRAILREIVPTKRIAICDVHSYCGILLDDNNRKPICRLHCNSAQKYVSVFDTEREERIPIEEIDDLCKYADRLKAAVARHDTELGPQKTMP